MKPRTTDPKQKALDLNLDHRTYGSFAEIGAGQEVAAFFFKAGAASQTVAKTISAYDMTFSDAIYGAEESGRYVCESRLLKMLRKEFSLLEIRLKEKRKSETLFFAFANTMATINFKKDNEGHGWIGLRFQLHHDAEPNDAILHVNLLDNDPVLQQQAVGILGVNLIYGCFNYENNTEQLVTSLMDALSNDRIEIDMFSLSGPDFKEVDSRILALQLVKNGMTSAALFGPSGHVLQPSEVFYKKNIFAYRGNFRPFTNVNQDMLQSGLTMFEKEPEVNKDNLLVISELRLFDLRNKNNDIDYQDYLERVEVLCSLGQTVLISDYSGYYRLTSYLSKYTSKKIGIVLGIYNVVDIFNEDFYKKLKGGILESFSILFGIDVKLYVYPARKTENNELYQCANFQPPKNLEHLLYYLLANDKIQDIVQYKETNFGIFGETIYKMICEGEKGWEQWVPAQVAKTIKEKKLFGYSE